MAILPNLFGGPGGVDRMLDDMRRLQQQMEKAFGGAGPMPVMRSDWQPALDVKENADGITLTAELPGLEEKDVEISLEEDVLTIKGEKRTEEKREEKGWHVQERAYGAFSRALQLPFAPKPDAVQASFAKGVLTVSLPRPSEPEKPKTRIEIKSA